MPKKKQVEILEYLDERITELEKSLDVMNILVWKLVETVLEDDDDDFDACIDKMNRGGISSGRLTRPSTWERG